ncbi:MAG TPA: efflux RND transporter periplasmic adaptor subunit, partial [Pirellulales bacterium]|nr:efflux RND transporter periplasmic adaptor subunit [Pirellulales bacterium]
LVDPGNIVHANDPGGMAVITQLQPIALVFTIPQDEISRVQEKLHAGRDLQVDAYDRNFKKRLAQGKLLALDNQVDSTTGTVRLKALFENKDEMLFPNQFVNARLLVDVKRGATLVPGAAVQRGPDSNFVYVVKSDETVEFRKVTTGPAEGGQIAVESGLEPGEVVVTDGVDKLQPGAKVALRERKAPTEATASPPAATAETSKAAREGAVGSANAPTARATSLP